MASSMKAPGVILPTVPSMGSSAAVRPTKGTRGGSKTVSIPRVGGGRTTPKVKAPHIRVSKPKMPKDASALNVPKAKRIRNGKAFSTKRKPVI